MPGNTLGTTAILHVKMNGTFVSNNGSGSNFRVKIKYGATTVYDSGSSASLNDSSSLSPFEMDFQLLANGATNAQKVSGRFEMGSRSSPTVGYGYIGSVTGSGTGVDTPLYWTAAVDSTVAQTLAVTIILGSSSSTNITRETVYAELWQ